MSANNFEQLVLLKENNKIFMAALRDDLKKASTYPAVCRSTKGNQSKAAEWFLAELSVPYAFRYFDTTGGTFLYRYKIFGTNPIPIPNAMYRIISSVHFVCYK